VHFLAPADMSEKFQAFTKRAQWNWKPPKDEAEASVEWYPVSFYLAFWCDVVSCSEQGAFCSPL